MNCTVPVVTGLPFEVTVAVNVTGVPVIDGLTELLTVVVVAAAPTAVVRVRVHPPAIEPTSPVASSTTNSCQLPLGAAFVNASAKVTAEDGAGAGAGKVSPAPLLVGL